MARLMTCILFFAVLILIGVTQTAQAQESLFTFADEKLRESIIRLDNANRKLSEMAVSKGATLEETNAAVAELRGASADVINFQRIRDRLREGSTKAEVVKVSPDGQVGTASKPAVDPTIKIPGSERMQFAPVNSQGNGAPPREEQGNTAEVGLELQAANEINNETTVSLRIRPRGLKGESGKYIITVKSGNESRDVTQDIQYLDGNPIQSQDVGLKLFEGENVITVRPFFAGKAVEGVKEEIRVKCNRCSDYRPGISARVAIGFEQIGASASGSKQSPFLDLFFETPFAFRGKGKYESCVVGRDRGCTEVLEREETCDPKTFADCPKSGRRFVICDSSDRDGCESKGRRLVPQAPAFSIWGNVRLSSIPVQSFVSFGSIGAISNVLGSDIGKANELTQSFDFLLGTEVKLPVKGVFGHGLLPGRSTISLIGSFGAINPLNPEKTAQIFKVPQVNGATDPNFVLLFPESAGKTNIAFVSPERDKFFRQYYGGLRFRTRFYEKDGITPNDMFPAMLDVTVGQNESITGTLRGVVGRIDGSTPFPLLNKDYLYIFGSAQMRLGKKINQSLASSFLQPADSSVTLTDTNTAIVPIDRYPRTITNRDRFRLGIAIDLFRAFTKDPKQ